MVVGEVHLQQPDSQLVEEGEEILDFAGPLGTPTPLEGLKKVAVIGGGLGTAIAYPQAKKLHNLGADVTVITGFRNKDLVILEDELKKEFDIRLYDLNLRKVYSRYSTQDLLKYKLQ